MRNILIGVLMFLSFSVLANQTKDDFIKYQSIVRSLSNQTLEEMKKFNPSENIKGYQEHTKEEKYYGGVEAKKESDVLKEQSLKELSNDPTSRAVFTAYSSRPRIEINKNSSAIKDSLLIQSESGNIVNGRSNENVNCEENLDKCEISYYQESCYVTSNNDGCTSQVKKGCDQLSSICNEYLDGQCSSYKKNYNCPSNSCSKSVVCTKDVFCADGSCVEAKPTQSQNFKETLSKLSTISQGADDFQNDATIFAGTAKKCIKRVAGYLDCCEDKGWGKDLNIAKCPAEEKEIGEAKQNYLAHFLGDYCSNWVRWPGGKKCIEHSNTYCIYPSKMARIVHQHGRLSKNQFALGDAEHPKCAGLTPNQLSNIDMTHIDFIKPIYHWKKGKPDSLPDEKAGIGGDINIDEKDKSQSIDDISEQIKDYAGENS